MAGKQCQCECKSGLLPRISSVYSQKSLFVIVIGMFVVIHVVESRVCTRLGMEQKNVPEKVLSHCNQSYQARCRWFSLQMCTFYEVVDCVKEQNKTVTVYRIVEECCFGYVKQKDGTCVPSSAAVGHLHADDEDETLFLGLSHGAYAGIVCAVIFIACVVLLTVLHYRKRNLRRKKQAAMMTEGDASVTKSMIPLENTVNGKMESTK